MHFYEEKLVGNNFDKNNKTFLNNDEHILKEEFDQSEIIKRMVKAPSFYKKYENADLKLKGLFMKLINMVDRKGIFNKATKIPDYRLVEKNGRINFCLITFLNNCLEIHLHRNKLLLNPDILEFRRLKDGRHSGVDWIEVKITNEEELEEIFNLVLRVYENIS